jgi:hypothetical protein
MHFKKVSAGVKNWSFLVVDTSGRWVGARKGGMRVKVVDVFCIYILK